MYYIHAIFLRNSYRSDDKVNYMLNRRRLAVHFLFYTSAQAVYAGPRNAPIGTQQNYHTHNRGRHTGVGIS